MLKTIKHAVLLHVYIGQLLIQSVPLIVVDQSQKLCNKIMK
jgi:hypothetical protein